jgi:hypothetical protein
MGLRDASGRGGGGAKRCHQCGGQFGLMRHYYLRQPFCSRRCLESFKRSLIAVILRKKNSAR